jgi:parallel beta-helix repeat protein
MKRLILLSVLMFIASAEARTLIVDPGGSGDSKTIPGAISMAQPGDEILLKPETYDGVVLDRKLSISGLDGAKIRSQRGSALVVTAPGCKISNLSIEAGGSDTVVVLQSQDNLISRCSILGGSTGVGISGGNNTLLDSNVQSGLDLEITGIKCKVLNSTLRGDVGVRLNNTSENEIQGCRLLTATGIEAISSFGNLVKNNSFSGIGFGVSLSGSSGNWISGNNFSGQYMSGIDVLGSSLNNISGNLIEGGKLGISLRGSENNSLTDNACRRSERAGLYTDGSFNNEIKDNELSGNGNGILLANSRENLLAENRASLNTYGISLRGSLNNILRNNSMESNAHNLRVDSGEESSAELAESIQEFFVQDIDPSNLVDGRPVCYLVGGRDTEVPPGCGFVGLVGCLNVGVANQTISNSSAGVLMVGSSSCRVEGCNISRSESGVHILNSKLWTVVDSHANECENGFVALASQDGRFENDRAMNCSESGFRADGTLNMTYSDSSAKSCNVGISLMNSRLCSLLSCTASQNKEAGIMLTGSHKCFLGKNEVSLNDRGIALSGSNACILTENRAVSNSQDGFFLEQLSSAELSENSARANGQGTFVHSSKRVKVEGNNLSENRKYGLRMSISSECNVTGNSFIGNEVSGANLVDCTGNFLYHNVFVENGLQNAVDNGENHWDAGPKIGGNFWSDHQVKGNPGNTPREIPSKGIDRYPFQNQEGWR